MTQNENRGVIISLHRLTKAAEVKVTLASASLTQASNEKVLYVALDDAQAGSRAPKSTIEFGGILRARSYE